MCVCVLSHVQLFVTPCIVAHQAPLSMELSRQEYWSGLAFPTPGDLPDPGIKPGCPAFSALAGRFFTISATWEAPHIFIVLHKIFSSVQFSSVAQSCLPICDPMDRSTPDFPVHHQHLELTQTHVHPVGDAIRPSHPLSSPSPPTFNLSQHQGFFQ